MTMPYFSEQKTLEIGFWHSQSRLTASDVLIFGFVGIFVSSLPADSQHFL